MFSFLASRKQKQAQRDALYRNAETAAKAQVLNRSPLAEVKPALGLEAKVLAGFDNVVAPAAAQAAARR
jgi:hypothetical protein